MMYFLEQLINGVSQGAIYALMAIGFTLIAGEVGLVSFTYGDTVMVGAFAAYWGLALFGENLLIALLFSIAVTMLLSVFIHKICIAQFFDSPKHIMMICTIGMSIFLKNIVQIIAGYEVKAVPELLGRDFFEIGGIRIGYVKIYIILIVLVLCLALSLFLNKTKTGVALRAVSQDRKASSLIGVDVNATTMLGNMLGCVIGGISGLLYAVYYGNILPTMGGAISMKAMSASVLGGLSNIPVAAFAGFIIGVFENLGIMIYPSGYRDLFSFIFLIAILIFKPSGMEFKFQLKRKSSAKGARV